MNYRTFGKTGWQVSELGHGMWGMAGWTGSDDAESLKALHKSVELGVNFFDTAWAYGEGRSEKLLGQLVRAHPDKKIYTTTKIPPKNGKWPMEPKYSLADTFPPDHMVEYTEKSLKNLGLGQLDLIITHGWDDAWAADDSWQKAAADLKKRGLIRAFGISIDRWEANNSIQAIKTGAIDAVEVIYNIFDQSPEDELFPICRKHNVGVIARVPFDEGTLTGNLTMESHWPAGDWRNGYFNPKNLKESIKRAEALKPLVPSGMTMPDLAIRFILTNPDVSTTIPGMRSTKNVEANVRASQKPKLDPKLIEKLRAHRWDRTPTPSGG